MLVMVNMNINDNPDEEIEITSNDQNFDPEISDQEKTQTQIISKLKRQIKEIETEKRKILEESQLAKADFLNAKRRLDEERQRDRQRQKISHIEELLPLADSFELAVSNEAVWHAVDETWRKGVEGIHAQLKSLLASYQVIVLKPIGDKFNPNEHEALGTEIVSAKDLHERVTKVIQSGYAIKHSAGSTELIRPARVIIGNYTANN